MNEILLTLRIDRAVNFLSNQNGLTKNLTNGKKIRQTRERFLTMIREQMDRGAKVANLYTESERAANDIHRILAI